MITRTKHKGKISKKDRHRWNQKHGVNPRKVKRRKRK